MTILESLVERISAERAEREAYREDALIRAVRAGRRKEAFESLMYFTPPGEIELRLGALFDTIEDDFLDADGPVQLHHLSFLVDVAVGMRSFLPRWNLRDAERYGESVLSSADTDRLADEAVALAGRLAALAPEAASTLLSGVRAAAAARFVAEQAADPEVEASDFVGSSIADYVHGVWAAVAASNLRRISEMRDDGLTLTEISNDYAAFLPYTLLLGASFATTNPPLVDYAWLADETRWNPVADAIIASNPDATTDELARLMTAEVVLANMRLLRPIFLLTSGAMGCVCLQVNPHSHADAAAMVSDAEFYYGLLRDKLGGGVPNVVFKLPGTRAGLDACRALTGQGIGVTITVNFGMFQHIPFAEAIAQGHAVYACLVEMNGRLAFPVRDELLGKLEELATHGIDEPRARRAAAWAGVAPIKRAYSLMKGLGYDLRRIKPLIASLRIYEGLGYDDLPSAFPDMTEILGASILSVFPNVRRAFDAAGEIDLSPMQIEEEVPQDALDVLAHSEIFKQAYYVSDRGWVPREDEKYRPARILGLDEDEAVFAWQPVHDTMTQFENAYDTFMERLLAHKRLAQ